MDLISSNQLTESDASWFSTGKQNSMKTMKNNFDSARNLLNADIDRIDDSVFKVSIALKGLNAGH